MDTDLLNTAAPAPIRHAVHLPDDDRMSPEFRAVVRRRGEEAALGLVADLDALDRRYSTTVAAAARHDVRLLCAVKASTHPEVLRRAAEFGLGFDIANEPEFEAARGASTRARLSLTSPALPRREQAPLFAAFARGEIHRWHCDSLAQLEELASACPGSTVGVRVCLDGLDVPEGMPLFTPSRFGIRLDQLPLARDIAARHGCALRWIHAHNGSEENDIASYVFAAEAIVAAARAHEIDLEAVDLGGGLLAEATPEALDEFFGAVRAAVPAETELVFEPGRYWLIDCMTLITQVLDVKETPDRVLLVLDLGLMSHLQWADHIRIPTLGLLVPDDSRPWRLCGRSCFEEDMLDEWEKVPVAADAPVPRRGDVIALGNISGYAIELSCDFNGVRRPTLELLGV
ncbi:diaminopimelate decarboxylase [Actinoalloteichus hoggarensis]|uniref:Diaminopimelate decarboxylase n=1 Tax=Actinoalloteichus hoggarensis TaxID=1470176 RepID=A0A221VZ02_9PSEU|nr:hypothetical protein [Actinoalloteichus hoggarensis]ASO18718.1 Diaminopimelate decarboxylase [Actinoalloteichus hoggarensis]MBB5919951.1 diaminopimelate decarboxylase [Actinoalloteichus hoggarensis]